MIPSHPFVPLYFDEEDAAIWDMLCRVEPEERSSYIKEVLRQTLLNTGEPEQVDTLAMNRGDDVPEQSGTEPVTDMEDTGNQEPDLNLENFDLNDLFVMKEAASSGGNPSSSNLAPWENLLVNVIGTEEDETVINVFRQASMSNKSIPEPVPVLASKAITASRKEEKPEESTFDLKDLLVDGYVAQVVPQDNENDIAKPFEAPEITSTRTTNHESRTSIGCSGAAYVLKHIIGEETDQEIIKLISQSQDEPSP